MFMRIGTRKSPLALAQAEEVKARLLAAHEELRVEIVPMQTSGDRFLAEKLAEMGGKGLFTKEIEEALLAGDIDLAVHSAKDMPTALPPGLILAATPEREDARDVLIGASSIAALPAGCRLGTASLRRAAQVLRVRPDIKMVPLRGNVQTRLRKIAEGEADATLLALAGLKRLKLDPLPGTPLSIADMLPAVAQGALALEAREDDAPMRKLLAPLNHAATFSAVACERALLKALDGSCRTPIAGYAAMEAGKLRLRAMRLSEDGAQCHEADVSALPEDAEALGREAARLIHD